MKRMTIGLGVAALVAAIVAPTLTTTSHAPVEAAPQVIETAAEARQRATPAAPIDPDAPVPIVDLVFVIDTTGSMGGLLDGAKETVWQVLDTVVSQQPQPAVRVGIVAYRDRNEDYVTTSFPLSDDLDAAHAFLKQLQPAGGGDGPESMGKGLSDALEGMPWSAEQAAFKAVFVVADAPDHAYPDELSLTELASRAVGANIVLNGILCGGDAQGERDLTRLARQGGGTFIGVPQDGGATAIATPYDAEMDAAEQKLVGTGVVYDNAVGASYTSKLLANRMNSLSTRASRRSTLSKQSQGGASGGGDLLDDWMNGQALDEVPESELPMSYQAMSPAQREADLVARRAERETWSAEVARLTSLRDAWLREERARRRASGGNSFDAAVEHATVGAMRARGLVL